MMTNIKGNDIGVDGSRTIAETLKINKTLTELNLGETQRDITLIVTLQVAGNIIRNEGSKAISESLKSNISLTELNLEKMDS